MGAANCRTVFGLVAAIEQHPTKKSSVRDAQAHRQLRWLELRETIRIRATLFRFVAGNALPRD